MSESVANALQFYGQSETKETERFIKFFDKFFDCLNVRGVNEDVTKKKPNLSPFRSPNDQCLVVCLTYINYTCSKPLPRFLMCIKWKCDA